MSDRPRNRNNITMRMFEHYVRQIKKQKQRYNENVKTLCQTDQEFKFPLLYALHFYQAHIQSRLLLESKGESESALSAIEPRSR